ncbi:hypothetical protein PCNPT3_02480 [Psychromonas sp. CNPT3]|nr:hypothetical protein PCNPT3_02480 [Psychromonas sp. CNPT3]
MLCKKHLIAKELIKFSCIAQEKLTRARREFQESVVLTSKITTLGGIISTSKTGSLFSSFGITLSILIVMID